MRKLPKSGYLTVTDKSTSKYLCKTEVHNVEQHCRVIRSSSNEISVLLNMTNNMAKVEMYIFSLSGMFILTVATNMN